MPIIVRVAQQSALSMAREIHIATDRAQICDNVNKHVVKNINIIRSYRNTKEIIIH
ncbi:hypothetical protein [Candidatus Kinetoplastidibacterium stringomonadis]|uniref:hypothetical protein n=1 Tax=Candidatus Kinetoplastidibacterium stringomonadis TaxID=994696 RepID=UPI0004AF1955|nr:hypothetical protein [Candidatus Kinetoplastibacterium oncopeltii]